MYGKTGSPDLADFAMTRHLIHWQVLALSTMVGVTAITAQYANRFEAWSY
jgi:hypothetical protein